MVALCSRELFTACACVCLSVCLSASGHRDIVVAAPKDQSQLQNIPFEFPFSFLKSAPVPFRRATQCHPFQVPACWTWVTPGLALPTGRGCHFFPTHASCFAHTRPLWISQEQQGRTRSGGLCPMCPGSHLHLILLERQDFRTRCSRLSLP